jgi:catechol 2,3-dioxygenase-like lactoylglutathione lyase family enzyme
VKEEFASSPIPDPHGKMKVERVKYVIWAADPGRAVRFYRDVLGAEVVKESEVISEVVVGGATIGIHGGRSRRADLDRTDLSGIRCGDRSSGSGGRRRAVKPGTATRRRRTSASGHVHRPGGKRVYVNAPARGVSDGAVLVSFPNGACLSPRFDFDFFGKCRGDV